MSATSHVSRGQLEAGLSLPPPALEMEPDWREQRRLWGHPFHRICSYLGSFPASLAHALVARYSRPGDVVLDPFCGRGTVPLQACVEGRTGVGVDLNPLAHVLTSASVDAPDLSSLMVRLQLLRLDASRERERWQREVDATASPASSLFAPDTLAQLLFLRARLDRSRRVDRFLLASLLGILHGSSRGYLTPAMPNAFATAPGAARAWMRSAATSGTRGPDVFVALERKVVRLYRDGLPMGRGTALHRDAREAASSIGQALAERSLPGRIRLVVTSPPYLRVLEYGRHNWLRLWLLGEDARAVDAALAHGAGLTSHLTFLRRALRDLREVLADDAVIALVLGDVAADRGRRLRPGPMALATAVWEGCAEPEGYRIAGVVDDAFDTTRKATRIWGVTAGRATGRDAVLLIGATEAGRRRAIAGAAVPVDWAERRSLNRSRGAPSSPERPGPVAILGRDAPHVPPGRSGGDGPPRPDEEPRSRPDDGATTELRAAAAGPPVHA